MAYQGRYDGGETRERGRFDPNDTRESARYDRSYRGDRQRDRSMFGANANWDRGNEDRRERAWRDERGRDAFGYDDRHEGLPIDETGRLIASNKVEGTAVYGRDGGRIGSVYNFMVDKRSGRVEYAVMTYGGFLGMGTRYFPLPWDILSYDTRLGGYRVEMVERDLERAPSFGRDDEPDFDTAYGRQVNGWYGLNY